MKRSKQGRLDLACFHKMPQSFTINKAPRYPRVEAPSEIVIMVLNLNNLCIYSNTSRCNTQQASILSFKTATNSPYFSDACWCEK